MTKNQIEIESKWSSVFVGVFLAAVTALMLGIVEKTEMTSGIDQVLVIISGMTIIAALSAFKRVGTQIPASAYSGMDISFNETWISETLSTETQSPNILVNKTYQLYLQPSPWDVSLDRLVGTDNSLALAKLRLEIERELRRIAYQNEIDIGSRPIGVLRLAEELVSKELIPAIWLGGLKEIISVCNQAVHGIEVSDEVAASVVRVGRQLLEKICLLSEKQEEI